MSNMLPYEYPAFLDLIGEPLFSPGFTEKRAVIMLILNIIIVSNNQTVCFICIILCEKLKEAATEYKSHVLCGDI